MAGFSGANPPPQRGTIEVEFHEKLQQLRAARGLTQEELARQLYVSRAAVSKWESGRGYPSIDSLRALARYFQVSIDALVEPEEVLTLAESDRAAERSRNTALLFGLLDLLPGLLLFLPVFGQAGPASVPLYALTGMQGWLKGTFVALLALTVAVGLGTAAVSRLDRPRWNRWGVAGGLALSVAGTLLFILARQPYAGALCLCALVGKGVLLTKGR